MFCVQITVTLYTYSQFMALKQQTLTIRPKPKNLPKLVRALNKKMKADKLRSLNTTIEAALLEYFNL